MAVCFFKQPKNKQDMLRRDRMARPNSLKSEYNQHGCHISLIVQSMREEQREHTYIYMTDAYIKYRKVVAEWMIDVCEFFNLHPTTCHAAIAYLDRLQPNENFSRYEWQMLAICCILISSKYNECEEHVPPVATLEEITQQHIKNETILIYEGFALKKMGWKINARTPTSFACCFLQQGVLLPTDYCGEFKFMEDLQMAFEREVYSLCGHVTLDCRYKGFLAIDVATAIIYWTRQTYGVHPLWCPELTSITLVDPTRSQDVFAILSLLEQAFSSSPRSELNNEEGEEDGEEERDQENAEQDDSFVSVSSGVSEVVPLSLTPHKFGACDILSTGGRESSADKENSTPVLAGSVRRPFSVVSASSGSCPIEHEPDLPTPVQRYVPPTDSRRSLLAASAVDSLLSQAVADMSLQASNPRFPSGCVGRQKEDAMKKISPKSVSAVAGVDV